MKRPLKNVYLSNEILLARLIIINFTLTQLIVARYYLPNGCEPRLLVPNPVYSTKYPTDEIVPSLAKQTHKSDGRNYQYGYSVFAEYPPIKYSAIHKR